MTPPRLTELDGRQLGAALHSAGILAVVSPMQEAIDERDHDEQVAHSHGEGRLPEHH